MFGSEPGGCELSCRMALQHEAVRSTEEYLGVEILEWIPELQVGHDQSPVVIVGDLPQAAVIAYKNVTRVHGF